MSNKMVAAALVTAVFGTSGCSGDEPAKPAPPSPAAVKSAPAAAAPSGSAEPKTLTRKEGGQKYLEIVKPFNDALDKCYFNRVQPILEASASSPSDFPKIRKDCAGMPAANEKFADDLEAVAWPVEARKDIKKLVKEVEADQLAWEEIAKVRTHDDLFNPQYLLSEDGDAASLVRAHLGLPPREEQ